MDANTPMGQEKGQNQASGSQAGVNGSGDVLIGGDVVGRDKIIQNIVFVGQVLNYAGLEGLIPKSEPSLGSEAVTNTLESVLDDLQRGNTLSSAAFAGEVLKAMFEQLAPREPFATVSTRRVLKEAPRIILRKLVRLGYWASYSKVIEESDKPVGFWVGFYFPPKTRALWLQSAKGLTQKYLGEARLYGLYSPEEDSIRAGFCVHGAKRHVQRIDQMDNVEFRVFLTSLVIDLARLGSSGQDDANFWKKLSTILSSQQGNSGV